MTDIQTNELIALGRDREAVAAATRTGPLDGVQQLDQIAPMLDAIVRSLTEDDLERATPCANFNVAGVLEHMVGGARAFAPGFRGDPATEDAVDDGGVRHQWYAAMANLMDAVHSEGAQNRTITTPFGELSGAVVARYVALDGLVHGWDLATATGRAYAPRAELVAQVHAFARELLQPEMRDGDTFAAETTPPSDASQLERLVAFTGRSATSNERAS